MKTLDFQLYFVGRYEFLSMENGRRAKLKMAAHVNLVHSSNARLRCKGLPTLAVLVAVLCDDYPGESAVNRPDHRER
jgi:hypothetical protein